MSSLVGRSQYSPIVRMGNWVEDNYLEQDKVNTFIKQRDSGELLVEKTRRLFENFHKEIELEAPKVHIPFGAIVQLMPLRMNICEEKQTDAHPALSVVINESVVRHSQRITDECELTIAPSLRPCVRNSFRIVSSDDTIRTNEVLKYGQHFRLECVDTENEPIYLFSAIKSANLDTMIPTTFDSTKCGEINQALGLVKRKKIGPGKDIPTAYTNWVCSHIDPLKRFQTDRTPLPSNKPLVITHVATNRNLAAENVAIQTLFGPEYLVSVQNYRNIFKRETWQNIWMICNGHQFK